MDIAKLQAIPLFRDLTEQDLETALTTLTYYEKSYRKEERILAAGDTTGVMGFVESGSVTVENNDYWGNRTILSLVSEGEFFGETYAFIKDETLLVDVVANEDTRIFFLRIGVLNQLSSRPQPWVTILLRNLLRISMQKNLALSGRSFHTSPKSARGRIMSYLNAMSLKMHADSFDIPFDRQQMADYLNLERTALSKELGNMKRDGLIAFRKNHFHLIAKEEY